MGKVKEDGEPMTTTFPSRAQSFVSKSASTSNGTATHRDQIGVRMMHTASCLWFVLTARIDLTLAQQPVREARACRLLELRDMLFPRGRASTTEARACARDALRIGAVLADSERLEEELSTMGLGEGESALGVLERWVALANAYVATDPNPEQDATSFRRSRRTRVARAA